jgi:2-iminobutanoate/2-iminopropanoate deaminase
MRMSLIHIPSKLTRSFSEAVLVPAPGGAWIMVSGQVGVPYEGGPNTMAFEDEVRVCFERLQESLGKLGATMAHVVKLQTYLTDLAPYAAFSGVRASFFPQKPPASTAVQVAGLLLNARIEMDVRAFLPDAAA